MISHSCLLIELGGKRILTDPWMTEPIYWGRLFHRYGLGLQIDELPPLDLIVASHGHDDHLDPQTLKRLDRRTPVAVLDSAASKVRKLGFSEVHPMQRGRSLKIDDLVLHGCHGKHPGGQVTFVMEAPDGTIYFAGDTAYDEGLQHVGRDFGRIDVALLPVSGGRLFFDRYHLHMSPAESAGLAGTIDARVAIPTHYHFALRGVPGFLAQRMDVGHQAAEFGRQLARLSPKVKLAELSVGERFESPMEA
jgi:L-ascorbate metabolism protein UlaG (beta-lactamase superfamily)